MIGAVITYKHTGICGACGQTVGADGSGEYAVVIHGDDLDKVDCYVLAFISRYLLHPYIKNIKIVSARETYSGNPITEVSL